MSTLFTTLSNDIWNTRYHSNFSHNLKQTVFEINTINGLKLINIEYLNIDKLTPTEALNKRNVNEETLISYKKYLDK